VITRPRVQAAPLARRIESQGARALVYPALEIAEPTDLDGVLGAVDRLAEADLAVFVSPTAVKRGMRLVRERGGWPPRVPVAAIGAGSRRELEDEGHTQVLAPDAGADSEALLAMPQLFDVAGKRIVIFRGEGGRELLGDALAARGASVIYAQCYRRTRPQTDFTSLLAGWDGVDAVTVFSAEALQNLVMMLGDAGMQRLRVTPLFVPHRRIAGEAAKHGIRTVELAGPGDEEMVGGLVAYFRNAK
jgi:uroporphyrinogen-III synthase